MYLWDDNLNPQVQPRWKVIKTLIYGVRSSGNQAERDLRKTGEITSSHYPRACEVITKDIYVDNCLSGEGSLEARCKTTDELKLVLEKGGGGGVTLKGITFSGEKPPEYLSEDGESVRVVGLKWFPEGDFLYININELNFTKKLRGRKPTAGRGIIPENLTKRDCVSRVAEIFDPLGKVTPIVCGLKLDISELSTRKLDWDDVIPDDLRKI